MYSFESRIRFSETDSNGRLSIGGLIDYFQDTSTFHAEDIGGGHDYLSKNNRAWIINSWQIEIDELPLLGEEVVVETWPYKFVKFIGYRNYVLRSKAGRVFARANSVWALYDMVKAFPSALSDEEMAVYTIEPQLPMEEKSRKIKVSGDFTESRTGFPGVFLQVHP